MKYKYTMFWIVVGDHFTNYVLYTLDRLLVSHPFCYMVLSMMIMMELNDHSMILFLSLNHIR